MQHILIFAFFRAIETHTATTWLDNCSIMRHLELQHSIILQAILYCTINIQWTEFPAVIYGTRASSRIANESDFWHLIMPKAMCQEKIINRRIKKKLGENGAKHYQTLKNR